VEVVSKIYNCKDSHEKIYRLLIYLDNFIKKGLLANSNEIRYKSHLLCKNARDFIIMISRFFKRGARHTSALILLICKLFVKKKTSK
jgi:hypothetical protein